MVLITAPLFARAILCQLRGGQSRLVGVGQKKDHVGCHPQRLGQGFLVFGPAVGGDAADKPLGQGFVLVVGKDQSARRAGQVEDVGIVVVEDDLKLVRLAQMFEAVDELTFCRGQRRAAVPSHAAGAIEHVDELVSLALDAEHARCERNRPRRFFEPELPVVAPWAVAQTASFERAGSQPGRDRRQRRRQRSIGGAD